MLRGLKAMLRQRLSLQDLEEASARLYQNPPIVSFLGPDIERLRVASGRSLLDWWRTYYRSDLEAVAEGGTWERQRAVMIATILDHQFNESIYSGSKDAKYVEAWSHYVRQNPIFSVSDEADWPGVMYQFWLMTINSSACLISVGQRLYGLDSTKEAEIDIYKSWVSESVRLDVAVGDMIVELVMAGLIEDARATEAIKAEHLNPLLQQRNDVMTQMREAICNRTLDGKWILERAEEMQGQQEVLSRQLRKT